MSYQYALEKAGAEILLYEQFGSYQGDWLAKVIFEGKQMWIHGSYGSCSGCDAFQGEFEMHNHECINGEDRNPIYDNKFYKCNGCLELLNRLVEFGLQYLYNNAHTQEEIEKKFKDYYEGDEILNYVKKNAITEKTS